MPVELGTPYPDLGSVFGMNSNPLAAWYGMKQVDTANQNQQQNLAQAQQDMAFQAQRQPLTLQQDQANIDSTTANTGRVNAEIPGIQAASDKAKQDQGIYSQLPQDQQLNALKAHINSTMSTDEYTSRRNDVAQGLVSPDPMKRKQAEQLWPLFAEQRVEASKEAAAFARTKYSSDAMERSRDYVADARGRYAAATAKNKALPPPKTYADAALRADSEARAAMEDMNSPETSEADKVRLRQAYDSAVQRHQYYTGLDMAARRQAAEANAATKPDPNAFNIATNPGPTIPPYPGAPQPAPAASAPARPASGGSAGASVIMHDKAGNPYNVPPDKVDAFKARGFT